MNTVLFAVLPYVAFVLAVLFGLHRYFTNRYSYTSLSSEILEKKRLFWGSVPWHYGIIVILLAHLFGGLFPGAARGILRAPGRLAAVELIGMALALLALLGIVVLIVRRAGERSLPKATTSTADWLLLILLALQVIAGIAIAIGYRWGSRWYPDVATPWCVSIVSFRPDFSTVVPLPALVKFHFVNGFVLILLFPFTRLVHIFTFPLTYLWRPYQVVIWNRRVAAGGPVQTQGDRE